MAEKGKRPAAKKGKRVTGRTPHPKKPRVIKPPAEAPRGARLNAARMALRDDWMLALEAQGYTRAMIAAEMGLSVGGVDKALRARRAAAPMNLSMDPVKAVEMAMTGYVSSIATLEAIATASAVEHNWAAAVGAKRAANDARDRVLGLLQATGRLPRELGTLRHLIDLRAIAARMVDAMDRFEAGDATAQEVRAVFHELIGLGAEEERSALPSGDG